MLDAVFLVLRTSAPVGLAALGETVGQKSGVLNIGLEGMMLTAAYAGMAVSQATGSPYVGLAAGVVAGTGLALFQGWFTLKSAADQVVCGTAVNLLGLGLTGTLYRSKYGASGQLLSVPTVPRAPWGADLVLLIWILAVVAAAYWLFRTKRGLALRATGEYPPAVVAAGYSPETFRWLGAVVSGAFAGLAGAYLCLGVAGSFAENMTSGRGFVALAMVTFGRWKPWWVFAASVLIGAADAYQYTLQAQGSAMPPQFFLALPYVLALGVLVFAGKGASAPAALGEPFR
ncbi:MAG: ABC transporter permease [Armatimonadetes bacterium]|nr:ABC transporter permease [Armatimonadota bacterium]